MQHPVSVETSDVARDPPTPIRVVSPLKFGYRFAKFTFRDCRAESSRLLPRHWNLLTILRISMFLDCCPCGQGNSLPVDEAVLTGPYKRWRYTVLARDNFTCVSCGAREQLEVDHIKPRLLYPDLTYDIDNGRTLCKPCHRKTPTWGSNGKILFRF